MKLVAYPKLRGVFLDWPARDNFVTLLHFEKGRFEIAIRKRSNENC